MKRDTCTLVLMAVFSVSVLAGPCPARAWEFSLSGVFTWEYDSYSQLGARGFFGDFDTDDANNPGGYGGRQGSAASMNGWLGDEIGQISSGSDLALATMYCMLYPQIRINKAVRLRGSYRIGSWATPEASTSLGALVRSESPDGFAPGINRSLSPGYWNTLWVSAQTPWGIVVAGKRPDMFGIGLMFDAEDNADSAGLLLVTSMGPMRLAFGFSPWFVDNRRYFTLADKNAVRQVDFGAGMTYDQGPFSFGAGSRYFRFRTGPEASPFQGVDDPVNPTGRYAIIPEDTSVNYYSFYALYNNGRFFFNAEFDWIHSITRKQPWLSSGSGVLPGGRSLFAPSYVEHLRAGLELGAYAGSFKVIALAARIEGPDRRHGVRIDRQGDIRFVSAFSNVTLFKVYSLLLSYTYGGGNNSFTLDSRSGYLTDVMAYGARVDYAIASNLNIFGTFFWADRVSHGYGWGFIRPSYDEVAGRFTGTVEYVEVDDFEEARPSIPDANLGYEIDFGFGWKLLEGYSISATFGYWQPGGWFKYATTDRSVPDWKTPTAANRFGTNPAREIDPVFGTEILLEAEF